MNKQNIILEFLAQSQDITALKKLLDRRKETIQELAKLEQAIASKLKVAGPAKTRRAGQRPRTGKRRKITQEILALLADNKEGLRASDITRRLKAGYSSVFQALKNLLRKKQVVARNLKYVLTKGN